VFGTARSLSKKGCPFDNAVDESTNKSPEAELVWGEEFSDLNELQARPSEYVWWHDNDRLHSKLDYMSPVEFRLAGHSL
jgi:transposase InsO family protein